MNKKVTFSMDEIKRLDVMHKIESKQLTGKQSAKQLGLSLRQVRRLIASFWEQGALGLVHDNRGRAANNRIPEEPRAQVLELAEKEYLDYNDSHLTEELEEKHGLEISRSTVRRIRRQAGLSSPRKRRPPRHRRRRERREKARMLLQTAGSRHDWLEGRGPWLTPGGHLPDLSDPALIPSLGDRPSVRPTKDGLAGHYVYRFYCHGLTGEMTLFHTAPQ